MQLNPPSLIELQAHYACATRCPRVPEYPFRAPTRTRVVGRCHPSARRQDSRSPPCCSAKGARTLHFHDFRRRPAALSLHCNGERGRYHPCRTGTRRTTHAAGTKPATAHRAEDSDLSSHFWMVLGSFAIAPAQENKGNLAELQKQIILHGFS